MLSFRKALILASFIIVCIILFHSSTSSDNTISTVATPVEEALRKPTQLADAQSASTTQFKANTPKPQDVHLAQQPIFGPGTSLADKLRYHFPYEPDQKFPAYIWQTWKYDPSSAEFEERLRTAETSWTELHPGFVHEVVTDKMAANLIEYLYAAVPEVVEAYTAMPVPVLKADLWRYLVLLARGGIYSDIDTKAIRSVSEWLPASVPRSSIGLVVGIEADPDRPDWKEWYSRRIQFCQWTIMAKPGHPVLRNVVTQIVEDTLRMKRLHILAKEKMDKSIVEFTGPARWTDTIFAYLNDPAYFRTEQEPKNISWEAFANLEAPKRVGDVAVLPITAFSPGVGQMGAKDVDDPGAFVQHDFEGSWKADWEHVKPVIQNAE